MFSKFLFTYGFPLSFSIAFFVFSRAWLAKQTNDPAHHFASLPQSFIVFHMHEKILEIDLLHVTILYENDSVEFTNSWDDSGLLYLKS